MSWPCKSTLSIEDVELRRGRGGLLTLVRPLLGAIDDVVVSMDEWGTLDREGRCPGALRPCLCDLNSAK